MEAQKQRKKDVRSTKAKREPPEIKSAETTTKIEPLRGGIETQFKQCGRSNCKCAKGKLHGPYYLRRWQRCGKRCSKYVKKSDVFVTFKAVSQYKRDRQETRELIREINESGNAMWKAMRGILREWTR
jgi:hypothetical protein